MGVDDDGERRTGHHVVMQTALGKGLAVLEAVASARGPVRVSHLAAELGMQKSSVHRVLQTLVEEGWLAQDARLPAFASGYASAYRLRRSSFVMVGGSWPSLLSPKATTFRSTKVSACSPPRPARTIHMTGS